MDPICTHEWLHRFDNYDGGQSTGGRNDTEMIGMNWLGESSLPRCFDEDALAYLCNLW